MNAKQTETKSPIPTHTKVLTPPESHGDMNSPETDPVQDTPQGIFVDSQHEQTYVGPTNWHAVLETVG
jgi:hypothetical protein